MNAGVDIGGLTLLSSLYSLSLLVALLLSDPKRCRVLRRPRLALSSPTRRALGLLLCLPLPVFIAYGLYAPLLLWMGVVMTGGWSLTLAFSARG